MASHRLLLAVAAVLIVACASTSPPSGEDFSSVNIEQIQVDDTPEKVLEIMQQPPHSRHVFSGSETWIWVYSAHGSSKSFAVTIRDDKVEDTFYYEE